MQTQSTSADHTDVPSPVSAPSPERLPCEYEILTIPQFSERHPAWSVPSLRDLRFKAKERQSTQGVIAGNGLIEAGAFIVIGTRVLINVPKFFAWVQKHNEARK